MTPFEWLALVYFAACVAIAARARSHRGVLYGAAAAFLVIVACFTLPWQARAWMPHAYLVLGYWIPATFTPAPRADRFEQWLCRADQRILGNRDWGIARSRAQHLFELAYLLCYPMVPAAFTVVFLLGAPADIVKFWVAVLLAGYVCYGTLPWTVARPPRLLDAARGGMPAGTSSPEALLLARINAHVLGRVSHNLNTFPSGHVAVALAAALIVFPLSVGWGTAFLAVSVAIAVAAVSGRYHYLIDVLAGVAVSAVAAAVSDL
jgi:membrane-associated phospholipid phosphatase